jgi:putative restriction endonuclease
MDLLFYSEIFRNLSVAKKNGKPAPHKAILLLSVIDLVASSDIEDERILYSDSLRKQFVINWDIHVESCSPFQCIMSTPFYHMSSECFWDLVPIKYGMESPKSTPSESLIKRHYKCARINEDLFELLKTKESRDCLREVLITKYLRAES